MSELAACESTSKLVAPAADLSETSHRQRQSLGRPLIIPISYLSAAAASVRHARHAVAAVLPMVLPLAGPPAVETRTRFRATRRTAATQGKVSSLWEILVDS